MKTLRLALFFVILLVPLASAWYNAHTHPWFCERVGSQIWNGTVWQSYPSALNCSAYPDNGYPNETRFENYSSDTTKHHCYATCPVDNETYCGNTSDCPSYPLAIFWFNMSKQESDMYYKLCYLCIGTHYLSDAGNMSGYGGVPFHKTRNEDSSCHSGYEDKADLRIGNLSKYGTNWTFTQTCSDPSVNFTLNYSMMLDMVDMIVGEYNRVSATTTTTTTSSTTTTIVGLQNGNIPLKVGWNLISIPLVI